MARDSSEYEINKIKDEQMRFDYKDRAQSMGREIHPECGKPMLGVDEDNIRDGIPFLRGEALYPFCKCPEPESKNMNKTVAIALLTGYVRGLWRRLGDEPDHSILEALRALGARPEHLPKTESTT